MPLLDKAKDYLNSAKDYLIVLRIILDIISLLNKAEDYLSTLSIL
jgi:hypothetical protein